MLSLVEVSKNLDTVQRELISRWRSELSQVNSRIKELDKILMSAEAKSDRSENALFQIAKDERDIKMESQHLLEKKIEAYMSASHSYVPGSRVKMNTTVRLLIESINGISEGRDIGRVWDLKLVDDALSDTTCGLLSVETACGIALLGKCVNDLVEIVCRKGTIHYRIKEIY